MRAFNASSQMTRVTVGGSSTVCRCEFLNLPGVVYFRKTAP